MSQPSAGWACPYPRDMATSSKEPDGISDAAGLEAVIEVAEKRIAK